MTVPTRHLTDLLVDYRRLLVWVVLLVSIALVPFALHIKLDRTLKSAYITSSPAYAVYKAFIDVFGDDEFVLVVINTPNPADKQSLLRGIDEITRQLQQFAEVTRVLSPTNFKVFGSRKGVLGNYPVITRKGEEFVLPRPPDLDAYRAALPLMNFLFSRDLTTLGIMVRIDDRWKFDPKMSNILNSIETVTRKNLPQGADFRMVGAPVIREAVQRNTVRTAVIFGSVCMLIVALVTLYIFKSFRVAGITTAVIGLAILWIIAFMAMVGIPLNSATSLSFGLVLVVSVAAVIHIVTHYYEWSGKTENQVEAAKQALAAVGRPCLMCSLTTSIAFGTIMVSSIPMVQQLGLVMSLGVLLSFVLSIILAPACIIALKPVDRRTHDRMAEDWITWLFMRMEAFVFRRYRWCAAIGILFSLVMIAGTPLVQVDTQILRVFRSSSGILDNLKFTEDHLTPVHSIEVVVETEEKGFKRPEVWKKMLGVPGRLAEESDVAGVDSPLALLQYLFGHLTEHDFSPESLFRDKRLLNQVLMVLTFSSDGKELLRRYVDSDFSRVHLSVRIKDAGSKPMGTTIAHVEKAVSDAVKGWAKAFVTGELVVFSAQASEVVNSQVLSLVLAFACITIMMIIQLRSWVLGLLSLIPNLVPICVIFGMMGWLGIALDNVTVFAATVAIGLSVDDTIHYLTQLKRDLVSSQPGERNLEASLSRAYRNSAKALISTSIALFLGFLALSLTPTRPAVYFGFLGSAAIFTALLGDLIFMPSIILTFRPIRKMVERTIVRTSCAHSTAAQGDLPG